MRKASKLASRIVKSGLSVNEIPATDVIKTLSYAKISDILDVIVLDFFKYVPDYLDPTSKFALTPAKLKLYLVGLVCFHFKKQGGLQWNSGVVVPDATGFPVPYALFAWLSYASRYQQGQTTCRPALVLPGVPAITLDGIDSGAPVVNNVALSAVSYLNIFSVLQREYVIKSMSVIASIDLNTFWQTESSNYADALKSVAYPCVPYPEADLVAPDASFYSFASLPGPFTATVNFDPAIHYLSNQFDEWDPEIAAMYFTKGQTEPLSPIFNGCRFPRCSLPIDQGTTAAFTTYDDCLALKMSFGYIMRNCVYRPGDDLKKTRNYFGEKLDTFVMIPRFLRLWSWNEAIWRCLSEINKTRSGGATAAGETLFCHYVVCMTAFLRRLQLVSPSLTVSEPGGGGTLPAVVLSAPRMASQLQIPAVLSQFLNDLGPVVSKGALVVPIMPSLSTGVRWYTFWNFTNSTGNGLFQTGLGFGTPPTTVFKWLDQTMSGAWVTAQNAAPQLGILVCPYSSLPAHYEIARQFWTDGVGFGRGEFIYPISTSPRGGASALTVCYDLGQTVSSTPIVLPAGTNPVLNSRPIEVICSGSPIPSLEMTMAFMEGWYLGEIGNTAGVDSVKDVVNTFRYCLYMDEFGSGSMTLGRAISEVFSPGGTFGTMLAEAMHKRHGPDNDFGIVGVNDSLDTCLWDAFKSIVSTVSTALKPIVPIAAVGCNAIVPGTSTLCASIASGILDTASEMSQIGTNRHETSTKSEELGKMNQAATEVIKASEDLPKFNRYDKDLAALQARIDARERLLDKELELLKRSRTPKPGPPRKKQQAKKKQQQKPKAKPKPKHAK